MARTKVHGEYLDPSVISAQTEVTAVGSDHMLIFDATDNALKKALLSDLIETVGSTPSFTSATISGDLTVDTSTLKVDSTNNRVGIGTASPQKALDIAGVSSSGGAVMRLSGTGESSQGDVTGAIQFYNADTTDNTPGVFGMLRGIAGASGGEGSLQILTDMPSEGADASNVTMHFNSNGNVGIGTTSPSSALHVTSTTANTNGMVRFQNNMDNNYETLRIESLGDYDAHIGFFADGSSNYFWGIGVDYSDSGKFKIANDNLLATNTRLTIDTSGNVGLGTDTPTNYYSGADNLVIYEASGEGGISVVTATNTTGALYFADGTSGNQQYRGGIAYQHGNDQLALVSGGATKATIDASGHLDLDGYIDNTRNNTSISPPSNSDHTVGTRIKFYDAGESVWYAMGIENNHLWFNADPGFKFYSDSVLSATIDDDGIKFNGDTAAANALDDYEEGTWTPDLRVGGTDLSVSFQYGPTARYTKIGRTVHVHLGFRLSSISGTSGTVLRIYGLPFASITTGGYQEDRLSAFLAHNPTADHSGNMFGFVANGSSYIEFRYLNGGDTVLPSNALDSNTAMSVYGIYYTNS